MRGVVATQREDLIKILLDGVDRFFQGFSLVILVTNFTNTVWI